MVVTHLDTPIIITSGQEVMTYHFHTVNWGTTKSKKSYIQAATPNSVQIHRETLNCEIILEPTEPLA